MFSGSIGGESEHYPCSLVCSELLSTAKGLSDTGRFYVYCTAPHGLLQIPPVESIQFSPSSPHRASSANMTTDDKGPVE